MIYPKNPYCPFDKDYMNPDGGNNGSINMPGDCMCPGNGNNNSGNNNNGAGNGNAGNGSTGNGNNGSTGGGSNSNGSMGNGNNCGNGSNGNNGNGTGNMTCQEMMKQISELEFAVTDLNLYLDTHSDCREALELFTKLSATLNSLKYDYGRKCAPICATDSKNEVPFQWVSPAYKWPWQA